VYSSCVEAEELQDCIDLDGCVWDENGCTAADPPVTTQAPDCDNSDLHKWRIDYIGKSTQFRIYDPCDGKFIKFKMEDLTEYDGDKKTNNKETSFASSKDWEWGENSGGHVIQYQGNDAIYNKFEADTLTKNDAVFVLETYFFSTEATIVVSDDKDMTLSPNSAKFNVNITNWVYEQSENHLVLCIGIMTNKAGDIDDDPETKTFYLDEFEIDNIENATCIASDGTETGIHVDINRDGNGNNHLDLCYTFDPCDGDISYDPILQIGNNANSKNIFITFITISIISFFFV
jgi:hypothetical protein